MGYVIAQLWPWMLVSGAIGIATGWWMWRRPAEAEEPVAAPYIPPAPPVGTEDEDAPAEPAPVDEPVPEPEPVAIAQPERSEPEDAPEPPAVPSAEAPPAAPSPFRAAPDGEPDDLTRIKGIGPKLNDMLHAMGVYHFRQIADWSGGDIAEVDSRLGRFQGRIERDRWVDQARFLAEGDMRGFRREFGRPRGEV